MAQTEKKSTKPRRVWQALLGVGLAAGAAWTLSSGLVEPPTTHTTARTDVELSLPYRGLCSDLQVYRGEEPLSCSLWSVKAGLAQVILPLEPGTHELELRFSTPLPGFTRSYPLTVVVDQEPPVLELSSDWNKEMVTTDASLTVAGRVQEPEVTLTLGEREVKVEPEGGFETQLALKPGLNALKLCARDRAGNRTVQQLKVFHDTREPELVWKTVPGKIFDTAKARLELKLVDDGQIKGVSGNVIGGAPVPWFRKADDRWVGVTEPLIEGEHTVEIKVADAGGRVTTSQRSFVINSSEALGEAVLGLGARGEDVKLLHDRLVEAGYLKKDKVGVVFTRHTEKAIRALQEAEGFEVTGRAEGPTLVALGPRIFVNLSKFSLVLDRPGKPQKRWMIASGSWEHPTPPGRYVVKEKVPNPTWLPPKSDWAKDAKPIPPGPGNPLGTRWIGLDWGGLGIHGTNAPWSVGTASSHGCMRMVTQQVEELYKLVEVGTPVIVLGGWEQDRALEKYWPKNPPPQDQKPDKKDDGPEAPEADPHSGQLASNEA